MKEFDNVQNPKHYTDGMMKCKYCGNDEWFYEKFKYRGEGEMIVNHEGEFDDTGNNQELHDAVEYKLSSVYYYCCICKEKVAKIPKEKRY